eukprot:TRINITY_DN1389_c0_g1_i5.p7 TRINITY_DN1389_c0_g1~~TRINITY_DN1389_c0_g1_i5.p7  ORF type:complete len:105 (-),score=1.61 TRINITY_DN1389_c0_g1_i5:37-351(-)
MICMVCIGIFIIVRKFVNNMFVMGIVISCLVGNVNLVWTIQEEIRVSFFCIFVLWGYGESFRTGIEYLCLQCNCEITCCMYPFVLQGWGKILTLQEYFLLQLQL